MNAMLRAWSQKALASIGLAVLLMGSGCTTVPETGRRQLNFMSPQEEMQLGLQSFNSIKEEVPISKDQQAQAMLNRVGTRIADVVADEMPDARWEFVLFDSEEANAFALPGGKVGVYTGILPITKDENGLATVIGHEVAHAVRRHGGERISHQLGLQALGTIVDVTAATQAPEHRAAINTAFGLGAQVGGVLPHSRMQEAEADYIGLLYMARAGYDPRGSVDFWTRFAEYGRQRGDTTPWFLRTHPVSTDRIENLQGWMPEALAEYERNSPQ